MVRKKNEYSPRPLNVRRARKFPKRMYSVERMVERSRALRGASDLNDFGEPDESAFGSDLAPTCPAKAKNRGSQFMFEAATDAAGDEGISKQGTGHH